MSNVKIKISHENIQKYGFSCFHYPDENFVINNSFERETTISKEIAGVKTVLFFGSISDLKLLSKEKNKRIVHNENFSIINDPTKCESMLLLSARAGWNQTEKDLTEFLKYDPDAVFYATYKHKGVPVNLGSGYVYPVNNQLGWIGMILVHEELRRQGIAAEIIKKCLEYSLLENKKEIIGLDATPMGMPLYKQFGFKSSFNLLLTKISKDRNIERNNSIEISELNDVDLCNNYIKKCGGTDMKNIFCALQNVNSNVNFIAVSKGQIVGIIMSRFGRLYPYVGLFVADSASIATSLLDFVVTYWEKKGKHCVLMMTPEIQFNKNKGDNLLGSTFKLPFKADPVRELTRMYQMISNKERIVKTNNDQLWNKILARSYDNFLKTKMYLENEKTNFLPRLYSIGGPEIS